MLQEGNDRGAKTGLAELWRNRDDTMAEALYARFSEPVCRLAERILNNRLKRKIDGQDIAQSVFRTLFRHASNGEYEFQHTGALWRMLVEITKRKVHYWSRHYHTDRRNIDREIEAKSEIVDGLSEQSASTADRHFAEELADVVESVACRLDERDAEIFLAWYYEQAPTLEIAERFCCSVATVNRVLAWIRGQIQRILERNA